MCAGVVPAPRDGERAAVPVEAPMVEAARRAAVRVVLAVHGLRLDEVAPPSAGGAQLVRRPDSRPRAASRARSRANAAQAMSPAVPPLASVTAMSARPSPRQVAADERVDAGERLAGQILDVRRAASRRESPRSRLLSCRRALRRARSLLPLRARARARRARARRMAQTLLLRPANRYWPATTESWFSACRMRCSSCQRSAEDSPASTFASSACAASSCSSRAVAVDLLRSRRRRRRARSPGPRRR